MKNINWWFVLAVVLATLLGLFIAMKVWAQEPMTSHEFFYQQMHKSLWKGLIGEAVSEGHDGMYAVACCVRNRLDAGLNTGLVALKRKNLDMFVKRQGVKYESMAKDICRQVFLENAPDVTKGATHYEAIERYGTPRWAKNMVRTVKIGEHTFMKEKSHDK